MYVLLSVASIKLGNPLLQIVLHNNEITPILTRNYTFISLWPQLSDFNKGRLIRFLEAGLSIRSLTERMNCSKRTLDK